jgi:hypothetical protein
LRSRRTCSKVTRPIRDASPRFCVEGLEARVPDAVFASHLLDQQLGIRPHVQRIVAAIEHPLERGQQSPVLCDVVRGDAQRAVELGDERSVAVFDANAVARGTGIAPRSAIDVRRHHAGLPPAAAAGGT